MINSRDSATDIAIVGMSALFAGAKDLQTYWQNILDKVDAVHEAPDIWTGPYLDPSSTENDRIYTRRGGFLGDLAKFNPMQFGIMPNSVEGGDPDHFLALKLAHDALQDAGYTERPFNRERAGIILGRGTFLNRGFIGALQHAMIVDQTLALLRQLHPELSPETLVILRRELKAGLPPYTADTAPALVPNVVTGRIANRLGLMGPNYVLDAACASSLVAVELAIRDLLSGRCDLMLAGGIQAPSPPQLLMIFCLLNALSRADIRPFDQAAGGTLLGEGLGILVLKRLPDAQRDGDRIYAVLKGVGSSSDGKGMGLLAPRIEGEVLALRRAYQESGLDPQTIGLIEAHGTGIPLGDQTEIQSLSQIFGQRQGHLPTRALGSVKSMIGHCTIAAGAAGLIKTALALYHKVLPPTLCGQVHPDLGLEQTPFYINTEARPWIHGNPELPRRAGVNSFGFGGVNAHAILEEYTGAQPPEAKLLHSRWSTELLVFAAADRSSLLAEIAHCQQRLQAEPALSLAELAHALAQGPFGCCRLAVLASDRPDLQAKLMLAAEKLADPSRSRLQTRSGVYAAVPAQPASPGKTVFLFPGEGSQYPNMLADLCLHFPQVRAWFDRSDQAFTGVWPEPPSRYIFSAPTSLSEAERQQVAQQLFAVEVATEAVFTAGMALYELLSDFGLRGDLMVGHSTGEHTALLASGIVRASEPSQLITMKRQLNQIHQELEASGRIPRGALLSVGALQAELREQLLAASAGRLHLAMDNCPNQVVLFGSESDIAAAELQIKASGGLYSRLPFDRAYHTPLFAQTGEALRAYYQALAVGPGHTPLVSCATCEPFPDDPEAIRDLAFQQWSSRVRFRETIEKLYDQGCRTFIEVGPSSNLTGFVDDILRGRDYLALASNHPRKSGLEQLQLLLARLFVNGEAIDFAPLYQQRALKPVSDSHRSAASPVLDLTLPVMQLRPEVVQSLRDRLHPPEVKPASPATNGSANAPLTPAAPDPRLSVLTAHFDLMQEFLSSQERVAAALFSPPDLNGSSDHDQSSA